MNLNLEDKFGLEDNKGRNQFWVESLSLVLFAIKRGSLFRKSIYDIQVASYYSWSSIWGLILGYVVYAMETIDENP